MRKRLLSIAVTLILSTTPVIADEHDPPPFDWDCGGLSDPGERALCFLLSPVVLIWPAIVTVLEGAGEAYETACTGAGFEYLSPEERGVKSGWKCTGLPRRDG